jgi:hypothetical protein
MGVFITPQAESNTMPPSPKTEINILFYILNFASIIQLKCNFFNILPQQETKTAPSNLNLPLLTLHEDRSNAIPVRVMRDLEMPQHVSVTTNLSPNQQEIRESS